MSVLSRLLLSLVTLAVVGCAHNQSGRQPHDRNETDALVASVVFLTGSADRSGSGEPRQVCIVLWDDSGPRSGPGPALLESLNAVGMRVADAPACGQEQVDHMKIQFDPIQSVRPNEAVVEGTVGLLWAGRRFRLELTKRGGTWKVAQPGAP